jgi:hypothetical protein
MFARLRDEPSTQDVHTVAHPLTAADVVAIWTTPQIGRIHSPRILIRDSCMHLQVVYHPCPLDGSLLLPGLVTTQEGLLGLLVAE